MSSIRALGKLFLIAPSFQAETQNTAIDGYSKDGGEDLFYQDALRFLIEFQ